MRATGKGLGRREKIDVRDEVAPDVGVLLSVGVDGRLGRRGAERRADGGARLHDIRARGDGRRVGDGVPREPADDLLELLLAQPALLAEQEQHVGRALAGGADRAEALLDDVGRDRRRGVGCGRCGRGGRWGGGKRVEGLGVGRGRRCGLRRAVDVGLEPAGRRLEELDVGQQAFGQAAVLAALESDERPAQLGRERADDGGRLALAVLPPAVKEDLEELDEVEPLGLPQEDGRVERRARVLCCRRQRRPVERRRELLRQRQG